MWTPGRMCHDAVYARRRQRRDGVLCFGDLGAARHVARGASATNHIHCVRRTLPRGSPCGSPYNVRVTRDDFVACRLKYMQRRIQLDNPYTVNVPLNRAVDDDVLLVHTWEGKPLPREHGGPVRMIMPKLCAWKGAKWVRKIAEPWFNDRYVTA